MTALVYSQFCYQGALAQECVDLASQCNAESGIGCRPLRAGPVVPRRVVVVLAKDDAITCARRLAAEHDRLPQSGHIVVQRAPNFESLSVPVQEACAIPIIPVLGLLLLVV